MAEQPPTVFPFKVSLETTGKYVQPQITVYGEDDIPTRRKAIALLEDTMNELKDKGFNVAPIMEVKDSNE